MLYILIGETYVDLRYKNLKPIYEISDHGNIRNKNTKQILKPRCDNGYYRLSLRKMNGKCTNVSIHRAVAITFIKGNIELQVNHIDGNKLNNNVTNLKWVTASENALHAFKLGLRKPKRGTSGTNVKHSDDLINCIVCRIKLGYSNKQIKEYLNLYRSDYDKKKDRSLIQEIRKKRKWKHKFDN